ncbi:hypothetical protein [Pseudaminobacter soli (ex Li et al. 2025)]|uniref:hypothetical protein n=1 Tax=Pseudaminobacter soli (ex Li et al. 2025) TaxID=1295366 RepID=UPI001FE1770B|nr:hypothetical protein [Mesorhizobium soli]
MLFGLSYRRELFDMFGSFDEQIRVGEDTLLNEKIERVERPVWNPQIVTLHRYPAALRPALIDQFHRGRRLVRFSRSVRPRSRLALAAGNMKRAIKIAFELAQAGTFQFPHEAVKACWLVPILAAAMSAGILVSFDRD